MKCYRNRHCYQVFVSHATADKWIATVICEKIEKTGAITFRDDRDIDGGDDIPERIRQQIIRSREMVVLLTPESVNRLWVLFELGAAWGRRSNFRIVTILDHVDTDRIPELIKNVSVNILWHRNFWPISTPLSRIAVETIYNQMSIYGVAIPTTSASFQPASQGFTL